MPYSANIQADPKLNIWFQSGLVIFVGAMAAIIAASGVTPLLAFVVGAVVAGAGTALAIPFFRDPADDRADIPADVANVIPEATHTPEGLGQEMIDALPVPLLVVDSFGHVSHTNSAACAVLPDLRSGVHYAHIARAPAFVDAVAASLNERTKQAFSFSLYGGPERHFDARINPVTGKGIFGQDDQVVILLEDRTRAHIAEQSRTDFIANAGHELRTPLASISGCIETLQSHAADDRDAQEHFLRIMETQAGRMQRLVDDLMTLSRIEINEHVRPVENVSLNGIANECVAAVTLIAAQSDITLKSELPCDGGDVIGDRDQLSQVVTNLLDNAVRYSGPGTTVTIVPAVQNPGTLGRVGISVVDTGPGIPRDAVHRLTERFYRVNVKQSRNTGGTGLGLAIVKHILNRHKGRLEIKSEPGNGSMFTVWLPVAPATNI